MRISFEELFDVLLRVLQNHGLRISAPASALNSLRASRDGVYSHSLNRFPNSSGMIRSGIIAVNAEPQLVEVRFARTLTEEAAQAI
jgi:3-dehydro-L-gulonate 2-dehydrogenase